MKRENRKLLKRLRATQKMLHQMLDARAQGEPWDKAKGLRLMDDLLMLTRQLHPPSTIPSTHLFNPHLQRIERQYLRSQGGFLLCCPQCGMEDRGNRHNGKPWCFTCNIPLTYVTPKVVDAIQSITHSRSRK